MMILEEPLEHFETQETKRIIKYLTDSEHPWSLVVVSFNLVKQFLLLAYSPSFTGQCGGNNTKIKNL